MVRLLLAHTRPTLALGPVEDLPPIDGSGSVILPVDLVVRDSA